jgi:cellulose synthase/poly-beta-1,6-N-acetylglucosamine synthase-like glycosyltransferase
MHYVLLIGGWILALAWFSRIVEAALGVPGIADISKKQWDRRPSVHPRVSIIVPARNEEEDIAQGLSGLLALDYDNYEVIAVNDRSTDRTGEIMEKVAASRAAHGCLKIVHVSELPSGWLGKTHAMWSAGLQATGEWLLFTDADVLFKPDVLRRALTYAESEQADHVVVFPRMIMKRPGEKMMIAFFQTLFTFGHRPWRVADPDTDDHMGVGAFNMVRRTAYEAVGTYKALRMEVLDDMKLGKVIKKARLRQRNVFDPLGQGRHGRGGQPDQELFRRAVISVVAHGCVGDWIVFPESMAVPGVVAGAWMGAVAVWDRARVHVPDLPGNVVPVFYTAVLFCAASDQHGAV